MPRHVEEDVPESSPGISPALVGLMAFAAVFVVGVAGLVGLLAMKFLLRPAPPPVTAEAPLVTEPAPAPSELAPPPAPKTEPVVWVDAAQPVKVGEVTVGVGKAVVGLVPLRGPITDEISEKPQLMLMLWVQNNSPTRKVDFENWNEGRNPEPFSRKPHPHMATLTDNFGNSYKRVGFGAGMRVVGTERQASVHPGKRHATVVVYEPPLAGATWLRLELDTSAFGADTRPIRFQIATRAIEWQK